MRLNRFLFDSIRRFARGERGSAMAAVLGLLGVTTVVGLTITAVTVNAIGYTTSTRADIQSRAAAEAGIDVTEAGLRTAGDCASHNGIYASSTAPVFSAQVSYKTVGNWITGCPVPTSTSVRVVSVGTAAAAGVNGATSGNTTSLEAIYAFIPATGSITATGGAVYGTGTNGLNTFTLTTDTTATVPGHTTADVVIKNGDFTCQNNTTISGNLIVQNGSVELNGCIVLGGIRASAGVSVNSGTNKVNGDVIASAIGLAANVNAVLVGPNSTITGNVTSGGNVRIDGKVTGSVTAAGTGTSTISPSTRIGGNLSIAGVIDYGGLYNNIWGTVSCLVGSVLNLKPDLNCALTKLGIVLGTTTQTVAGLLAPAAPAASNWMTYTYNKTAWQSAGFTEINWTGPSTSPCTIDGTATSQVLINQIMSYTTPVVVNALNCPKLLFSSDAALRLKLKTDVAFVSNAFGLENMNIDSAVSANVRAWFIVPGVPVVSGLKLCLDINGHVNLNSGVKVSLKVAALIYTPGCIDNSANTWHGQFYGGIVNFGQNISLSYVPVGLPGVNLDGGTTTTTTTGGVMGSRTSLRDLAG